MAPTRRRGAQPSAQARRHPAQPPPPDPAGLASLYSALSPPTRAFSASLSHPSGGGPDLIAHTSDSGTWATEFKYSHFIDYTVTAAGPIALSVPEKDEKDEKDSRRA